MSELIKHTEYKELIENIWNVYQKAKNKVISAINIEMLNAYWEIGKYIIEFEQGGNIKAEYGKQFLENLSKQTRIQPYPKVIFSPVI